MSNVLKISHEEFIKEVASLAIGLVKEEDAGDLKRTKLTYGAGKAGLRGVTYYDRWLTDEKETAAFVEVCSFGESNPVQLAGTTIHELGHVLAGLGSGHSGKWKCACEGLGLRRVMAAGTDYKMAMFDPRIRASIQGLIERMDGAMPVQGHSKAGSNIQKPCSAATGVRGGTSRGVGSGSRLRKWVCGCEKPQIVRASTDDLQATCKKCGEDFMKAE